MARIPRKIQTSDRTKHSRCLTYNSRTMQENPETIERIYQMTFASVYPMYIAKAEKKWRSKAEVDEILFWLTGYCRSSLQEQIEREVTFEVLFSEAPQLNENVSKITGSICWVKIEEIQDPLYRKIRYLDKLIDELAKGKVMEKILRK